MTAQDGKAEFLVLVRGSDVLVGMGLHTSGDPHQNLGRCPKLLAGCLNAIDLVK